MATYIGKPKNTKAAKVAWRYWSLTGSGESLFDLTHEELFMFMEFAELFWTDNVRVQPLMAVPPMRSIGVNRGQLPLGQMYPSKLI